MGWPCTWWETTGLCNVRLRTGCDACATDSFEDLGLMTEAKADDIAWSDTCKWPESCSGCGKPFDYRRDEADDNRSITRSPQFIQPSTGEIAFVRELPIGALFDCGYGTLAGPDGRHVVCVIPGEQRPIGVRTIDGVPCGVHHWHIDSRSRNCGRPEDNTHHCWCRHGDVTKPETVHVDKACDTCSAGAGSIAVPGFHGFLHAGEVIAA